MSNLPVRVARRLGRALAPRRKASAVAYHAAGSGRRAKTWTPTRASINAILAGDLDRLRARARDAVRNNPHGASAVETLTSNIVGTGIVPRVTAEDDELRGALQRAFARWADEADADGRCDFFGLQTLIAREMAEAGEVLVRYRRRRAEDGLTVPLQIQLIEPEHLDATLSRPLGNGRAIRNGVQFDAIGRREGYWLWRQHPGDQVVSLGGARRVFVPASEVEHVFSPLRAGQVRGVPWLASTLTRLYEIDHYDDAELVRKKMAAMFAGFVQFDAGGEPESLKEIFGGSASTDDAEDLELTLEAGTMQKVPAGWNVKFSEPADVGGTYEVWMRQQLRTIAAAIGITYEQMTGDLSNVNYSSIRAGLLEFRRRVEAWQHNVVVFQFCRPVWRRWATVAAQTGAVPARGFAADPTPFFAVKWIPQGWQWVDPQKEIKAIAMAIRAGLVSRQEAIAEYGYDAEEIDREIAADNARADELGLVLDSDARKVNQSGGLHRTRAA